MDVQSNLSKMVLLEDNTQIVNEPRDMFVFIASFPILVVAVVVNIWAGMVISQKDDTRINKIIVCDCGVNALSMLFDTLFFNAPWSILKSLPPCYILIFAYNIMVTWNRLVPVAIVGFRYMMVCRAVYCHNIGGEKAVLGRVMTALVGLCFLGSVVIVLNSEDSVAFLRCMGREEAFR